MTMSHSRSNNYLVCYDIRDPKRLRRIHKTMCGWGMPLQYSVFHCDLTDQGKQGLIEELSAIIDHREDGVRVYALKAGTTITYLGKRPGPAGAFLNNLTFTPDENNSQEPSDAKNP